MYTPVNPSFIIYKWGLWGSKLYKHVFVMVTRYPHSVSYMPLQNKTIASYVASFSHCIGEGGGGGGGGEGGCVGGLGGGEELLEEAEHDTIKRYAK